MITNTQSGTRIDEVGDRIYRISTPVPPAAVPGGFSFNQYLVAADEPLLFHTGLRGMFDLTREAIATVLPASRLRWIAFSHFESDECGALNQFLALAPAALPVCGRVNAMINADSFDRPPHVLADGDVLPLGSHRMRWFDTPHLPHAWECGYLFEERTRSLLCGDLFTRGGAEHPAVTEQDIVEESDQFRRKLDYWAHATDTGPMLERLAATNPQLLACMHGSAWRGDGAKLLRALAASLSRG